VLEHRAYWAIRTLNLDLKTTGERQMLELSKLDELWFEAYESFKIYNEKSKRWHDKDIIKSNLKKVT